MLDNELWNENIFNFDDGGACVSRAGCAGPEEEPPGVCTFPSADVAGWHAAEMLIRFNEPISGRSMAPIDNRLLANFFRNGPVFFVSCSKLAPWRPLRWKYRPFRPVVTGPHSPTAADQHETDCFCFLLVVHMQPVAMATKKFSILMNKKLFSL